MKTCSHVFVRTDSIRNSLQQPYRGPYQVIKRTDKIFTVKMNQKDVNVSADRVKPCFSDNSDSEIFPKTPVAVLPNAAESSPMSSAVTVKDSNTSQAVTGKRVKFVSPTVVTRSGREVRIPFRYR